MNGMQKITAVLKHIFSRKTLGYIFLSLIWTMLAVLFWNWYHTGEIVLFESAEITLTIMGGKLLLYAIWDWLHLREPELAPNQRVIRIITPEDAEDPFGEYCVL